MELGEIIQCHKCGKTFSVGKSYKKGVINYCYDCLMFKSENISSKEFNDLGITQKKFILMINGIEG